VAWAQTRARRSAAAGLTAEQVRQIVAEKSAGPDSSER
jgi:hypothetical protein